MPHRGSSPFMSPPLLIIVVPIIAFMLLFLALPSFLSATSHFLRPTPTPPSVKKTWDSLNILLVLFAILCGVFARRNDDESYSSQTDHETTIATVPQDDAYRKMMEQEEEQERYVSQHWFGFSEERKFYDVPPIRLQSPATGVTPLRRSSSSYPDLRHESSWETGADRYKFRCFDDFEIDKRFRSPPRDHLPDAIDHRKRWPGAEEDDVHVKEIPVDTFEIRSSPPLPELPPKSPAPPTPPPPPPPPPQPDAEAHRKPSRTRQTVPHKKEVDNGSGIAEVNDDEFTRIRSPSQAPPTPPPPPQPSVKMRSEHKRERRKSKVKREMAMVWASVLSNQKKRKKKQRTNNNQDHHYDNVVDELPNNTTAPPPRPPPPPPPPPPPSVFQSLFRKGLGKSKKIHSVSTPPPAPPPPPALTSSRRWSKSKSQVPPPTPPPRAPPAPPPEPRRPKNSGRPPLPTKVGNLNLETINTGNQSPLIPIPPPPPPFKMPAMKFVVSGDFVKIHSGQSSRCRSPEWEDIGVSSTLEESDTTPATATDGEGGGSVFCPSPDVNAKAATFIARLRDEWKLEKLNSLKEKGHSVPF